ncbi:hypothetical protein LZ32DRAFT_329338 [Colletotrichum eremochloae]|nr:hypothetical protein LZ32DRAFT_329338 [Colletotrichum eremochloae]
MPGCIEDCARTKPVHAVVTPPKKNPALWVTFLGNGRLTWFVLLWILHPRQNVR